MEKGLGEYIDSLKFIIEQKKLKDISDEAIFREACTFMRGKIAGEKKAWYKEGGRDYHQGNKKEDSPTSPSDNKPTKKQLGYLRGFSIPFDEKTITKQEAIKLISNHKESGENTI